MATGDPTTVNNSNLVVGGIGGVSLAALTLAIFGTFFHTGNLVSTQTYTTARVLNGSTPFEITTSTGSTATGGLKSGGTLGNYQAITVLSPQSATNAPLNGLNTGTGVVQSIMINPVAPQVGGRIACSVANVSVRGSGGTILLNRTMATGAVMLFSTGSTTIGPTESVRCSLGVSPSPNTNSNIKILIRIIPSQVVN